MVATLHLHYLGHRINYGNLEVGNTTQQLLSTTRPCCSIEFVESFLFWVILATYNTSIYTCIYIKKLAVFIPFVLSSTVLLFLRCMLNSDVIFLDVHSESILPFMEFFFSRKLCFLWSPCLLLTAESINLDTSCKTIVGSWIILPVPLNGLNSINWLLKSWWSVFLNFYFIVAKEFWYGKKY